MISAFTACFWALSLAVAMLGCASRTAVVVVVDSDLSAPDQVAAVRATVGTGACGDGSCVHDFVTETPGAFPFSFVLEPRSDASASFTLDVAARDAAGLSVVEHHVATAFVPGRTLLLHVRLSAACRSVPCGATDTCEGGVCVARLIDPSTLPDAIIGHELDGLRDAGGRDAASDVGDVGPLDAPLLDGGGVLPTSCFELSRAAPSGLTTLDPDGAGGDDPFDAWCENVADGGGWTLLAKVDPSTDRLAFDAAEWTAPRATPTPFGSADETVADAILMPYWTVRVTELRVGSGSSWLLLTSAAPMRRTLRAAMGDTVFQQTADDWAGLLGDSLHDSSCALSGLGVRIPETGMAEVRVRVGIVGSSASDCTVPTYWYGAGASVNTTRSMCTVTANTAGGGRVCGPPARRHATPMFLLVYGR